MYIHGNTYMHTCMRGCNEVGGRVGAPPVASGIALNIYFGTSANLKLQRAYIYIYIYIYIYMRRKYPPQVYAFTNICAQWPPKVKQELA